MNDIALPGGAMQPASQGTAVEQARAVAEVAAAVRVARDFPRDETTAATAVRDLCGRLPIAQRAFYALPRGEGQVSGLTVHIARELARAWGNIDYGVRELRRDDDAGVSEMQAWAWDQEQNVRSTRSFIQPHARMKNRRREALTDLTDIYLSNQNTGARAVRECIFTVLPGWLLVDAEAILRDTLERGDGQPDEQRAADCIAAFARLGVDQTQLEARLKMPAADWRPPQFADLNRVYMTITQDGIAADEFFPETAIEVQP